MRTLHVAALPFPTQQGTQALLHEMLVGLAETGHDTHVLCYAHDAFHRDTPYQVHRLPRLPLGRSLRSGPSPGKLALDVLLVAALRHKVAALEPELVVAHHVEAALAALLAGVRPLLFVAHTSLSAELPSYFPTIMGRPCAGLGWTLDRVLCRGANRVVAVSPLLARRLHQQTGVSVSSLALPWPVPPPIAAEERRSARTALGLDERDEVVLYAGNLDPYQGLGPLAAGLSRAARPRLRWLIATASEPSQRVRGLSGLGRAPRVQLSPLASEADRRRVHAAADVVVVPRQSPGGVPIKLLDALARGAQVIAVQRALAGLPLDGLCTVIADDEPGAWQLALTRFFSARRPHDSEQARRYMRQAHGPARFVADFLRHAEGCGWAAP